MVKVLWLLFPALLLLSPRVKTVDMQQLQTMTGKQSNDTLYVVNFWATWCKPCVHEMPYFETSSQKFKNQKVKFIFVSTNYAREAEQVKNFINQKKVQSDVLLINAGTPNSWIDAIDSNWSGAIPATIMYKHGKTALFHEGEFTQAQLDSVIQKQIY